MKNSHRKKSDTGKRGEQTPSHATVLVAIVIATGAKLWHCPEGNGYATLPASEHSASHSIRSKRFRQYLSRLYYSQCGTAIGAQAMQDAITTLEGIATFDGDEHRVYVRLAEHRGKIYLDLGTPDWQVVEIAANGWQVVRQSPVKFRRAKAILPLPIPVAGGDVNELREYINVSDADWPLVPAWLLGSMRPSGPFPVLVLHGEQGSGKSTQSRMLRSLVDPNCAPVRAEPKDSRDLMIAANNSWVVALDNISHLSPWLSDALCRLSTGGGFSVRMHYENDEEQIFDATRPVILNGIEEVATRSDLVDRSIMLPLPTIRENRRRSEADLWKEFEAARPRILGALLTAVSTAIKNLPMTKLDTLPRMADFALWATSGENALGLAQGDFSKVYGANRDDANNMALESSPVVKTIMQVVSDTAFNGTATELLELIDAAAGFGDRQRKPKGWPATGRALSGLLKRYAPNLRKAGFEVEMGREGKERRRMIRLERVADTSSASSAISEGHVVFADAKDNADASSPSHSNGTAARQKVRI